MTVDVPWILVGDTDRGLTRSRNEDSFAVASEHGIAVVADGMGGHPGGDVASRIAVRVLAEALALTLTGTGSDDAPNLTAADRERAMRTSVLEAHEAIRAQSRAEPALAGMGTTASALVFDPTGTRFTVGNAGDSRVYRFRDGVLTQLTRDDTLLQQLIEAGEVRQEAAHGHPHGHLLTQCLGLVHPPEPRILEGAVEPGDAFVLCSDGLTACLSDEEAEGVLGRTLDGTARGAERAVAELIRDANAAGGVDNITVIVALSVPLRPPPSG